MGRFRDGVLQQSRDATHPKSSCPENCYMYLPKMPSMLVAMLLANEAISHCRLLLQQWDIGVALS
eukprot:1624152-Amphidinium_carterae.1